MQSISIAQVLTDLRTGKSARITVVKSTGTVRRGELSRKNVIHAFAYEHFKKRTPLEHIQARESNNSGKYAKAGIIPLVDTDSKTQLTILISHIVGYDGKKVIH